MLAGATRNIWVWCADIEDVVLVNLFYVPAESRWIAVPDVEWADDVTGSGPSWREAVVNMLPELELSAEVEADRLTIEALRESGYELPE